MTIRKMLSLSTGHLSKAAVEYLSRPASDSPSSDIYRDTGVIVMDADTALSGLVVRDRNRDAGGRFHRWVESGGDSMVVYPTAYGWLAWVYDELGGEDADEVPLELDRIFLFARNQGVEWIEFDRDAGTIDELEVFATEEPAPKPDPIIEADPSHPAAVIAMLDQMAREEAAHAA
jgi:hypothetical protein